MKSAPLPRIRFAGVLGVCLSLVLYLPTPMAVAYDSPRLWEAAAPAAEATREGLIPLIVEPQWEKSQPRFDVASLPDHIAAALAASLRFRFVQLNPEAIAQDALAVGDTLYLGLFEDARYWAVIDRVTTDSNGVKTIRGRIQDTEYATILLSIHAGQVLARIELPALRQEYVIFDLGAGLGPVVQEIDPDQKDEIEPGPALVPPVDDPQGGLVPKTISQAGVAADTQVVVDVMIVYTPAARQWADINATSINLVINQAIAKGQLALDNSLSGVTLNLVYVAEVNYAESGVANTDLYRLSFHAGYDPWGYEGEPRYMEEIHGWRDAYGADLVALFARVEDVGGLGWLLNTAQGWPELGFQLIRVQQAHTGYTHVHEMGHNMGAHHHKAQLVSSGPGLYSFSAGWRWTGNDGGRYCSVMTYESGQYFSDGLTHVRVPYFSNPSLSYAGAATGDPVDGDNARTIVSTKGAIAGYRPTVATYPDLVVTAISLSPPTPTAGGAFTASVTVKNQGTASADGGLLDVWSNLTMVPSCGAAGTQRQTVGTLAAGESATLVFADLAAEAVGTKTFRAFVDSACMTDESDEGNNQSSASYTVDEIPPVSGAVMVGVWRPSTGRFYLDSDGSLTWTPGVDAITDSFGIPGDIPVAGDWNGDGKDQIAVWRPSTGRFYLDIDGSRTWTPGVDAITASFGVPTDVPVAGDWNGDGTDDIGMWRPSTGRFYLDSDGSRTWTPGVDAITASFGVPTDRPVAEDWNGDGIDDVGVWRPSTARFYLDVDGSSTWTPGVDAITDAFGIPTDRPVAGDWNDDGTADIGVWRPSTGRFYLDSDGSLTWNPGADVITASFGLATDLPVAGRW